MDNRSTLKLTAVAILVILGVTNLLAQSAEKFEVASVRRVEIAPTDRGVPVFFPTGGIGTSDPGRITYRATWLSSLIADAFNIRGDQISEPAGISTERYDIVATIPAGATKDQFKAMLRNLLIDRFGLRFHWDSKVRTVYELRAGKNGSKLRQTQRRADDGTSPQGVNGASDAQGCPILRPTFQGTIGRPGAGEICWAGQDVSIAELVRVIEQPGGRPVMDETGLTGRYDFKIHFQSVRRATDTGAASDPGPTIFSAVEEELGLKLESASRSFPQLIIDSIEREPTPN